MHSLTGKGYHCPLRFVWLIGPIFKFSLLILMKVQPSEICKSAERGSRGWEDVRTEEEKHFSCLAGLLLGSTASSAAWRNPGLFTINHMLYFSLLFCLSFFYSINIFSGLTYSGVDDHDLSVSFWDHNFFFFVNRSSAFVFPQSRVLSGLALCQCF